MTTSKMEEYRILFLFILRKSRYFKQILPQIFTKKLNSLKQRRNLPEWVGAFENILSLVVQLYYKRDCTSDQVNSKTEETKRESKVDFYLSFVRTRNPGERRKLNPPRILSPLSRRRKNSHGQVESMASYNRISWRCCSRLYGRTFHLVIIYL